MTPETLNSLWWIALAAYFLGSIPFGYLIARAAGVRDVRESGSGSTGATNVARSSGAVAGVATLLLDAAKGFAAVWLASRVTSQSPTWMIVAAVAAIAGHTYPLWLGGRGGKGVATSAGAFLLICWPAVCAAAAIWAVVLAAWRYVSLASIFAAAALPPFVYLLYAPGRAPSLTVTFGTALAAVIVILRHRDNMRRLMSGTEPKAGSRRY